MAQLFALGDRMVCARTMTGIRRGTCGTITGVLADIYDIDFDGKGRVRLVCGAALAPVVTPAAIARCYPTRAPL
jgi:hypothetical protein